MTHFSSGAASLQVDTETGRGVYKTACGETINDPVGLTTSDDWAEVDCDACLAAKPSE